MFNNKLRKLNLVFCVEFIFILVVSCDDCPEIKTKAQWAGRLARNLTYQLPPIKFVVIHHTATDECSTFVECSEIVQNIQTYYLDDLHYDDIGYNFLIGGDGNIYEGTGWGVRGSHTYGYNMNGTGIAFIGNFISKLPPSNALKAAKGLLDCGVQQHELHRNYRLFGGLQAFATKSPGITLYNEIMTWSHWVRTP